jgi:ParB family chromosome partitioning protein
MELVESISAQGILQPLIVRPVGEGKYELVAGERRWRAAQELGLGEVPVIVRELDDAQMLELALVENIQREDLNAIDRALGYRRLMAEFNLTQEQAAGRVGQDRSTVANTLRLLELPQEVQDMVSRETLSAGHARAILGARGEAEQMKLAERVARRGLSVRETEALVMALREGPKRRASRKGAKKSAHVRELEERIRRRLGAKVSIETRGKGTKGRIVVEFFSNDDFERILKTIGVALTD